MPDHRAPLDPQAAALLADLGGDADQPFPPDLAELRRPWPPDDPALLAPRELLDVADLEIPAEPPARVRVYVPETAAPRPALVWLHPGGFVAGAVADIDGVCRALAADGRCTVVSVDYRLAPEHPFPAAVDDTVAVLGWLAAHAATIGVDPARLAVGGQSAGATIAASALLRLQRAHRPLPRLQVLAYPVLDPALAAPSYTENDGVFLASRRVAWTWERYLGGDRHAPPPLAAPLLAPSLAGLPPTLLIAAGHDPARDDARRYAERLTAAGVRTELVEYRGTIHAFLSFAGILDVARDALALIARRLRADLGRQAPRLHHVALPYPPAHAAAARGFYGSLLGLSEKPVPAALADRAFIWYAAGPDETELHLIPDDRTGDERSSERHACLATERLPELIARLRDADHDVETFEVIVNRPQAFVRDPFGNLLELTSLRGPYA